MTKFAADSHFNVSLGALRNILGPSESAKPSFLKSLVQVAYFTTLALELRSPY